MMLLRIAILSSVLIGSLKFVGPQEVGKNSYDRKLNSIKKITKACVSKS